MRKRGLRWKRVFAAVGALVLLAALGVVATTFASGSNLRQALKMGRLARLPEPAYGLRVDGKRGLFSPSSHFYLKFAASAREIDQFLASSPGLVGVQPEALGPERMYLPQSAGSAASRESGDQLYFQPAERYPWFNPTIRVKGRRYVIPPGADGTHGEVVIDDVGHVVFIRVTRD